jgi:ATP-binding cassette subfamily B protein
VADPAVGRIAYSRREFLDGWATGGKPGSEHGIVLLLQPTPALHRSGVEDAEAERGGFSLLWSYMRSYGPHLARIGFGAAVLAALQLALPLLTQALVDLGIAGRDVGLIRLILAGQLVLILSRTSAEFIQGWLMLHVGGRVHIALVADFLAKLMRLPIGFLESRTTGDVLQRAEDHARIEQVLTQLASHLMNAAFSFVIFAVALALYDSTIFAIFLAGSALYVVQLLVFMSGRRRLDHQRFRQMAQNRTLLLETIAGMKELKINGAEQEKRWEWERAQARLYRISERGLRLDQLQQGGAVLINHGTNAVITAFAANLVVEGSLTLGGLLAVQYILGQLNAPLSQVIPIFRAMQDTRLSLDRIKGVRDLREESVEGLEATIPEAPDIRLENVRFGYHGAQGPLVLRDLSLTIPYGKVTAIVGSSGSGKTTLLKLLLKLYEPLAGSIRLGDVDLASVPHKAWRARCGVVMQDGRVFSDTIARNIVLHADEIDARRLVHACEGVCLDQVIRALPLQYNTRLGAEGLGLSEGQKQRLLIARAIYRDPEFLFFDEATSALDAETERQIVSNLARLFERRTVVVIAHRLSTVRRADQIVVLERGQIVETGTHDELVSLRHGRYFQLVRNQLELER